MTQVALQLPPIGGAERKTLLIVDAKETNSFGKFIYFYYNEEKKRVERLVGPADAQILELLEQNAAVRVTAQVRRSFIMQFIDAEPVERFDKLPQARVIQTMTDVVLLDFGGMQAEVSTMFPTLKMQQIIDLPTGTTIECYPITMQKGGRTVCVALILNPIKEVPEEVGEMALEQSVPKPKEAPKPVAKRSELSENAKKLLKTLKEAEYLMWEEIERGGLAAAYVELEEAGLAKRYGDIVELTPKGKSYEV